MIDKLKQLFQKFTILRFAFVSGTSFLLDLIIFQGAVMLLESSFTTYYILISTVIARCCSSIFNFLLNKMFVFKSSEKVLKSGIKYYILVVVQMMASACCVKYFFTVVDLPEVIVKFCVDVVLFLISYQIQKRVVFR